MCVQTAKRFDLTFGVCVCVCVCVCVRFSQSLGNGVAYTIFPTHDTELVIKDIKQWFGRVFRVYIGDTSVNII